MPSSSEKLQKETYLKDLEQLRIDASWLKTSISEPLSMIERFDEFSADLKRADRDSFYNLFNSDIDTYKKLWGEPAFTFEGKHPWQTWIFKLTESESLVILSAPVGGTSFEYDGIGEPSDEGYRKVVGILTALKDVVKKRKEPDAGLSM